MFVYDPSAVLLELSYLAVAEDIPEFDIPEDLQYRPAQPFFDNSKYRQFYG